MLSAVTSAISTVITWVGSVITALTDSAGDLYVLLVVLS